MVIIAIHEDHKPYRDDLRKHISFIDDCIDISEFTNDTFVSVRQVRNDLIYLSQAVVVIASGGTLTKYQADIVSLSTSRFIPTYVGNLGSSKDVSFISFLPIEGVTASGNGFYNPKYNPSGGLLDTIEKLSETPLTRRGVVTDIDTTTSERKPKFGTTPKAIQNLVDVGDFVQFKVKETVNATVVYNIWGYIIKKAPTEDAVSVIILDGIPHSSVWIPGIVHQLQYTMISEFRYIPRPSYE